MTDRPHQTPDELAAAADPALTALEHSFGFSAFRPHQEEIVRAVLEARDVFAALPTGGGKSLCYQLPSLLLPGLTVVVSPLIALMHDQVQGALQNGVPAAYLNSSLAAAEARDVWSRLGAGSIRLLYVSPERIAVASFRERLAELGVTLFAIDEAHCISEWGHEFRPDYRALSVLRDEFPEATIAAFTATATSQVQADVISQLSLRDPLVVRGDFDRREIFYRVVRKQKVAEQILAFVRAHGDEPGIIYRATRKAVEQTATQLSKRGIAALPYHAGLSDEDRRTNQDLFVRDEVQVVVATIAFGMGIDKSNVRWVLHGDLPRSLEAYYQESGRAGRDGDHAEACLIYGPQDLATIRYHIDRMEVPEEQERARERLREMVRYVSAGVCRRVQLLAHFGQEHPGSCAGCDTCADSSSLVDQSVPAQMAMSAMARTGQRFGAHHIADIVSGARTDRVTQFRHDDLPTFGVGAEHPKSWWLGLIGDLEAAGLVRRRDGAASGLVISDSGRRVLLGKETFLSAARDEARFASRDAGDAASPAPTHGGAAATPPVSFAAGDDRVPTAEDEELFQCLRSLRRRLAKEQSVPPYVIFSDKSLKSMAMLRPANRAAFLQVHGVGDRKADLYGERFLNHIAQFETSGCPE
ncbi:MAG: DNA helicase RecQ [Spirochaetota bacterium]